MKACRTHREAVMAFVVAMAGIMLPAISVEIVRKWEQHVLNA